MVRSRQGAVALQNCNLTTLSPSYFSVWYKIKGNGAELRVSTCTNVTTLDTYMTLYTGSCESGSKTLFCAASSDNDPSCDNGASTITWSSKDDNEYYIFVQGPDITVVGNFGIFVEEASYDEVDQAIYQDVGSSMLEPRQSQVADIVNDLCANAIELSSGVVYSGSTVNASIDTVPSCADAPKTPGVWFKAVGTGKGFRVSTCHSGTLFDTRFQVFQGTEMGTCGDLFCVPTSNNNPLFAPDKGCSSTRFYTRSSNFQTKAGSVYFILLQGFDVGALFKHKGQYEVTMEEIDLESNDLCIDAEKLDFGEKTLTLGSTLKSTADNETYVCESYDNPTGLVLGMPGVWYELGTNEQRRAFRASTCNEATDFDTKLSVFVGDSCSELSCVGVSDDDVDCSTKSTITWRAPPGERFYVQVHGYFATKPMGNFGLSIDEFTVAGNDECADAPFISPSSEIVTLGSTSDALVDDLAPFCYLPIGTPGVWYRILGTGASMRVSTCTNATNFDTRIAVYGGEDCDSLRCIYANSDSGEICNTNADASAVDWKTAVGETYHILVFGAPRESGDFGLKLMETDTTPNDLCHDATVVDSSSAEFTFGTTDRSMPDIFAPTCGEVETKSPGNWFSMRGTGGRVAASTCFQNNTFPAHVAAYAGSCDLLVCVNAGTETSDCGGGAVQGSRTSWLTARDEEYHLLVHGINGTDVGDFGLSLDEEEPPSNDACASAQSIDLTIGSRTILGSTWAAYEDVVPHCQDESGTLRGIWYMVEGSTVEPGSLLLASTCSGQTTYDARMSIYSGSCGRLSCVDASKDAGSCGESRHLKWNPSANETYFIFVHGSTRGEVGSSNLSVKKFAASPNNECEKATDVMFGETVEGSTQGADQDADLPFCGAAVDSPSVWYAFTTSSSSSVTARIRGLDFSGSLSATVFSGSCGSLSCVSSEEFAYSISWAALRDVTYYILIRRRDKGEVGNFELEIAVEDSNDFCPGASELQVGGDIAQDSTDYVQTVEGIPFCDFPVVGAT